MFQYFAAGKPICCNIKLNYSEISRNNLGIDRNLETPEEYAAAIRELSELPIEKYKAMCQRVRETARRFDYRVLAAEELKVIERMINARMATSDPNNPFSVDYHGIFRDGIRQLNSMANQKMPIPRFLKEPI